MFTDYALFDYEKKIEVSKEKWSAKNDDEIKLYVRGKLVAVTLFKIIKHKYKNLILTIRYQHAF